MSDAVLSPAAFEKLTCTLLRGEEVIWPYGEDCNQVARYLSYLDAQGVQSLVHLFLSRSSVYLKWPRLLRLHLAGVASLAQEVEKRRIAEIEEIVTALAEKSIAPILLKGTPLAYSLYVTPHIRTRADTDLLIPVAVVEEAHSLMECLGYHCQPLKRRKYSNFQFEAEKRSHDGLQHRFDMHWKISNRMVLARVLGYQELATRSVVIEKLGPGAHAPVLAHSLLLSCLHRAGETYTARDRLIWLYDIHLLLKAIPTEDLEGVIEFALERQVGALLRDGWLATRRAFGTAAHAEMLERLDTRVRQFPNEPSATLLSPSMRGYQERFLEMRVLEDWSSKLQFLWESLVPPAEDDGSGQKGAKVLARLRVLLNRLPAGFRRLMRRSL